MTYTPTNKRQNGLDYATAQANVGSASPLTSDQFLEASIDAMLDGFVERKQADRRSKLTEAFAKLSTAEQAAVMQLAKAE
jgi:hypothetical protein